MSKTKLISYLGLGIALYVVLGCIMNIPILANSHLQTDLGYIAFGFYCYHFGIYGIAVGVIGCLIESLITSGWIPIGWMLGQTFIGLLCGLIYKNTNNKIIHIIITILAIFIGIGLIKTGIECYLYSIPFSIKFAKNCVAVIADIIPMLLGLLIGYRKDINNENTN